MTLKGTPHLLCVLVLAMCLPVPPAEADHLYTFSIVPQLAVTSTALIRGPVIPFLEQRTGHHFQRLTSKNIPAFEPVLREGSADFSYMNPCHYSVFHEGRCYQTLPELNSTGTGRALLPGLTTRPLCQRALAESKMADGDFTMSLPAAGKDEAGLLVGLFRHA